jgi:predicted RNA-binding protein with PUA domain
VSGVLDLVVVAALVAILATLQHQLWETHSADINKPSFTAIQKPAGTTKAMKLGSKSRDVESFVDQLKSEGENVVAPVVTRAADVHLRQEERLTLRVGRDGGLQNFELHGLVTLRIADEKLGCIRVQLENKDTRGIQLQTRRNVDKEFKFKLSM